MCVCVHVCNFLWPYILKPTRLLCPSNVPGKNTGVCSHVLLQRIFPTQQLNSHLLCLLYWQANSLSLCHLGSPFILWSLLYSENFLLSLSSSQICSLPLSNLLINPFCSDFVFGYFYRLIFEIYFQTIKLDLCLIPIINIFADLILAFFFFLAGSHSTRLAYFVLFFFFICVLLWAHITADIIWALSCSDFYERGLLSGPARSQGHY